MEIVYRNEPIYTDCSDVNSCGDSLAVALKDEFCTDDGSFDLAAFKAFLKENGVTAPTLDMERHGAIRRFRMCAGLMLRRRGVEGRLHSDRQQENRDARYEEVRTEREGQWLNT